YSLSKMSLEAIRYANGELSIIDQLLLPHQTVYIRIASCEEAWSAIKRMQVRGAPAIGIVGSLAMAVELKSPDTLSQVDSSAKLSAWLGAKWDRLVSARPTAVNLQDSRERMFRLLSTDWSAMDVAGQRLAAVEWLESQLEQDVRSCRAIGEAGANALLQSVEERGLVPPGGQVNVLTHCNTGSLATGGYGTALGVVRSLHNRGRLGRIFCTETRPYNQGARLTAYEIVADGLPGTLICDSMVAAAMASGRVHAVVLGADRIVSNGDTANKIGTYQIAVLARHHSIPFFVAAPLTSIDFSMRTGSEIVIEERPSDELACVAGQRIACRGIDIWNPAFDVTPAELITAIVTDTGVVPPNNVAALAKKLGAEQG
ncbi:hypothetical protein BOX15_Mlig017452g1, partial [Macrostomum lignano]